MGIPLPFTLPGIEPRTCWTKGRHATIWASAASHNTMLLHGNFVELSVVVLFRKSPCFFIILSSKCISASGHPEYYHTFINTYCIFLWQVKVTEIVDVTDADSSVILSPDERENNTHLEFDDEWNEENLACSSSWLPQQAIQIEGWFSLKLYKCFENPMSVIGHLHCEVIKLFFFNNKIFYYCFPYLRAARITKLT